MHMSIVTFRALCTMSVLAAAKCAANAVVQNCKVLSCLSKCVLKCKCQIQGHYILSRVWTHPFLCQVGLKLEEVPNWMGNLCLSLSQCKPSASRCDATSEEKKKLRPKTLYESYLQGYLSNSLSSIRLLCVPVMVGTKIVPACKKSYSFWDTSVQCP